MPRMSARAAVIFLAALVLLWVTLPRLRPATDEASTVRDVESRLARATARDNAKILGSIVAGDFFAVDADGHRETRATILDRARRDPWRVKSFRQENLEIHFYGKTAVATGVDRIEALDAAGRDRSGSYRFLHVFQRRDGRWWLIAGQGVGLSVP